MRESVVTNCKKKQAVPAPLHFTNGKDPRPRALSETCPPGLPYA